MQVPLFRSSTCGFHLFTLGTVLTTVLLAAPAWAQSSTTEPTSEDGAVQSVASRVETPPVTLNPTQAIAPTASPHPALAQQPIHTEADLPQLEEQLAQQPSTDAEELQPDPVLLEPIPEGQGQAPDDAPVAPVPVSPQYDVVRDESFRFSVGVGPSAPTALEGSARPRVTRTPIKSTGLSLIAGVSRYIGDTGSINLVVEGGEHIVAFDLGYTQLNESPRSGFGVNFFNQRSFFPAFRGGDRDVDLPNGDTPWIHRLGGGAEVFLPIGDEIDSALGVNYQRVSVRDDVFDDDVYAEDEFGNDLTVDSDGIDDLLSFNFVAYRDTRNAGTASTEGNILRFGATQGFTLGSDSVAFTRFGANFVQYIPLNLFGFSAGPRTLVLNIQGGHIFGDVPPYEAFNIGGTRSVRGFSGGGVGTGRSFMIAVAEYRFPIATLDIFSQEIDLRGALFVDFGTDFGTGDDVIGEPAEARDKPGTGLGFGVGLQAELPIGFGRLEFAITDNDESEVIATIGDRF